jgi:uncharacterized protein YbjQ (UPF0145 family)
MKVKEIARTYGIDGNWFANWLPQSGYRYKTGMLDLDVDESQSIPEIVAKFKDFAAAQIKAHEEEVALQQAAAQELSRELAGVLVTSGFNFDGYTITKYSGYISGDDIVELPRGNVANVMLPSLVQIRRNALIELKQAALDLGCNAVIGVDFDYLWIDPVNVRGDGGLTYYPYISGVTANGNAVIIEANARTSSV